MCFLIKKKKKGKRKRKKEGNWRDFEMDVDSCTNSCYKITRSCAVCGNLILYVIQGFGGQP
jgi:CRISPR/Cas system-associated protein Cas10 (large subunit of type III CRISPR-Cas system)